MKILMIQDEVLIRWVMTVDMHYVIWLVTSLSHLPNCNKMLLTFDKKLSQAINYHSYSTVPVKITSLSSLPMTIKSSHGEMPIQQSCSHVFWILLSSVLSSSANYSICIQHIEIMIDKLDHINYCFKWTLHSQNKYCIYCLNETSTCI